MKEKFAIVILVIFSFVVAEIYCGGTSYKESSSSLPPSSNSRSASARCSGNARCGGSTSPSPSPSCPNECQQNFEQDPESCECRCTKSSECEKGYYWLEDACSCLLVCDYIMECPADQKWDFIKCGCVEDQSSE